MSLPNSKAHRPKAAEKPSANAPTAQRKGQGKALRTLMRGELTVSLRSKRRIRMVQFGVRIERILDHKAKTAFKQHLKAVFCRFDSRINAC
jgi:hypothetical protein